METPSHDLLPVLKKDSNVKLADLNPLGNQYTFRFNTLFKPFDNAKIRQAVMVAFNQKDFLEAVIGDAAYYKICKALFPCGSPNSSTKGMEGFLDANAEKAKALLKEAGYDGTPVVLMQSTDLTVLTNLAPVAKNLMEKAGMKVDMQAMDWQTLVARRAKKDPPTAGGWNAFLTSWVAADILASSMPPATRPCSAGRATRRWSRCVTSTPMRPTRPSSRPSPRPCRCAKRSTRRTSGWDSGTSRRRCERTSAV